MEQLDVYLRNRLAGRLDRIGDGSLSFCYDAGYLASPDAVVLSNTLPLSGEPYGERDIAAFFSNLLPDEGVRRRIAEILHLTPEDTFGLLRVIGGDCAGAVSFQMPGNRPTEPTKPRFRALTDSESASLLRDLANRPLGIDGSFRGISGAGAQDKLIACVVEGKILLPLDGTPSTHIIKPDLVRFPQSVFNEWFCMKLSAACGFDTAASDIVEFGGEPYYVTVRYDRQTEDGVVTRLHQEDFCQLLKCRPEIKYQDQGGPSLVDCSRLIREMRLPVVDLLSFIDRVVFNFIVGNGDAHGKNFSVLYHGRQPRLAPVYDVLSTTVYPTIAKRMAMKFDGKYEFRWISAAKIARTFARAGIGEKVVVDSIARISSSVKSRLPLLLDKAAAEHPSPIYHDIAQGIHRRLRQLSV